MIEVFSGESLRKVRKTLGLTQGEFAEPIGISGSYVSDIEKGKATPAEPVVRMMIAQYRISRRFLETGEGEMFISPTIGDTWRLSPKPGDAIAKQRAINEQEEDYLKLDENLMREVIEAVEEFLKAERKELAPEKKGLLIVELYKEFAESEEKKVDKAKVIQFIRLAA